MVTLQDFPMEFTYLGDGLYAGFDGMSIWLCAYDGIEVHESVALELETYVALQAFAKHHAWKET